VKLGLRYHNTDLLPMILTLDAALRSRDASLSGFAGRHGKVTVIQFHVLSSLSVLAHHRLIFRGKAQATVTGSIPHPTAELSGWSDQTVRFRPSCDAAAARRCSSPSPAPGPGPGAGGHRQAAGSSESEAP
jgi:hypothetical protein